MRRFAPLVLVLALVPAAVSAQEGVPLEAFDTGRFRPAPGPGNYLQVDGAQVAGHLMPAFGVTLDYAHKPFVLFDASCTDDTMSNCDVEDVEAEIISYTFTTNIWASLSIKDRIQIGLILPLVLADGEGYDFVADGMPDSLEEGTIFTVGDPILHVKANFLNESGFSLGGVGYVSAPLGHTIQENRYVGHDGVSGGAHLAAQFITNGFHIAANVGGAFRPKRTLFSTTLGSTMIYRLALGYEVTPLVLLYGELDGASTFSVELDENPMEARVGARLTQGDFQFGAAVGAGIISGIGVPQVRAIGQFSYSPVRGDTDGDGVDDSVDACPSEPEDADNWEDEDGCPEDDNDRDGILDSQDPCPNLAEDMDGFEDEDGCPDEDNDGDGVRDGFDSCPDELEDMDGDRDEDGCPDDDTDRDGIEDSEDQCPNEPEDTDGFGDEDGCPEEDFDHDGIPDEMDECPDEAEVINGVEDENGCPEPDSDGDGIPDPVDQCPNEAETLNGVRDDDGCPDGEALIQQEGEEIKLLQQIQFGNNSASIRRPSLRIVDAVATLIKRHPEFQHVRIEGHTDSRGNEQRNVRLSQERADAVRDALVERGVASDRLSSIGYGPTRPIADNETRDGRAANRRVEFHIQTEGAVADSVPTDETPTE